MWDADYLSAQNVPSLLSFSFLNNLENEFLSGLVPELIGWKFHPGNLLIWSDEDRFVVSDPGL